MKFTSYKKPSGAPQKVISYPNRPFTIVQMVRRHYGKVCELTIRNKIKEALKLEFLIELEPRKTFKAGRPESLYVLKADFNPHTMRKKHVIIIEM